MALNRMKTHTLAKLFAAAFGLTAFPTAGCAQAERTAEAPLPPAGDAATTADASAGPGPGATVQVAVTAGPNAASAQWSDIKDCTHDMRTRFFAGLQGLEARVDDQISELVAKRATLSGLSETQDWDFAMKEMGNARAFLKSSGEDLSKATEENWEQRKDKVGRAWVRTQEAYGKVKSSTTS
jgi:hypothetical protein